MTTPQHKLLTALLTGDYTRTDLRTIAGVYGSTATHAISRLSFLGWATDEKVDGVKTRVVSITSEGRRALRMYASGVVEGPKVAPRTFHRKESYQPSTIYSRNNGNVHIPSHGVRC